MHFVIYAVDREDAGNLRLETRPSHLEYLKGVDILYAGPLLDENSEMCGSLIVVNASNLEEAKEISRNDPYFKAGLFKEVNVTGYKSAVGPT